MALGGLPFRQEVAPSAPRWARFAHWVRANDSFLALLIGAWLATFSIFLMDNFRAATAELAAWNVVKFEMQSNAAIAADALPVVARLAGSQATYGQGQLPMPEPLLVRGDDLVMNKALINLFGKDADPFLSYYVDARSVNREREAFMDYLNAGPTIASRRAFYDRVQGFYITLGRQMTKLEADAPAAASVTDRNWRRASRDSFAKSLFFYGMLAGAVVVSIIYLIVRRATHVEAAS